MNGDHALVGVSIPGVEFIYGIGTLFQSEQLVAGYRLVRIDHLIVVHWKDRIIPDTFIRLYNQIDGSAVFEEPPGQSESHIVGIFMFTDGAIAVSRNSTRIWPAVTAYQIRSEERREGKADRTGVAA